MDLLINFLGFIFWVFWFIALIGLGVVLLVPERFLDTFKRAKNSKK